MPARIEADRRDEQFCYPIASVTNLLSLWGYQIRAAADCTGQVAPCQREDYSSLAHIHNAEPHGG